jgi:hypothetical protein
VIFQGSRTTSKAIASCRLHTAPSSPNRVNFSEFDDSRPGNSVLQQQQRPWKIIHPGALSPYNQRATTRLQSLLILTFLLHLNIHIGVGTISQDLFFAFFKPRHISTVSADNQILENTQRHRSRCPPLHRPDLQPFAGLSPAETSPRRTQDLPRIWQLAL